MTAFIRQHGFGTESDTEWGLFSFAKVTGGPISVCKPGDMNMDAAIEKGLSYLDA